MNSNQLILLVVSLLAASVASAAINIGTVPVGNAGNANDTPASGPANGFFNGHHPKSKFRAIIHFIILLALTSFPLQSASAASVLLDNFDSYATASTLAFQGG